MKRRQFIKQSGRGMAGLWAASALSRSLTLGQAPPSERIRVGFVGVAGRAGRLLQEFADQPDVVVSRLAEIDPQRVPGALKTLADRNRPIPFVSTDFRRLIDDPDIDVLVVGTPDHWHAIPTIMGCLAGKDVYVEKPDGHNMLEGQRMVEAMRKNKRIVQLGTQARSSPRMMEAIQYIRSGALGRVLVAKAWESARQGSIGSPPDTDPPPGVDYDFWLGPAPKRPFNPRRFHGSWRWFLDYGTGDLGNDGVHRIDYARWALEAAVAAEGARLAPLPRYISALGGKWYFDDIQEWPDTLQVSYEFPTDDSGAGRILTYEMRIWTPYPIHQASEGAAIYGDKGYLVITNRQWTAYDPSHTVLAEGSEPEVGDRHVRNFLDCVKSRERPNADLETIGHPASLFCHAGNAAWRAKRQLELDPETERFVNDRSANALRSRERYRKPWKLPRV